MIIIKSESGKILILEESNEKIESSINSKYVWLVDFRPFRMAGTSENGDRIYQADNEVFYNMHVQDEEFIKNYDPVILIDSFEHETVHDIKLPSGRWLEQIQITHKNDKMIFKALVDAYGTYNEQR